MAQFFKASPAKSTKSAKNRILKNIKVEKLDHQGRAIAFFQNKPLFINGGLIGESLDIQIIESKKRYSKGRIKKINQASEMRIESPCPHYFECGGCQLQHVERSSQLDIKSAGLQSLFARFASQQKVELEEPVTGEEWAYRRTVRFGLQFNKKNKLVTMGFRQGSTNDLINQQVCPVLLPELEVLIDPLKTLLNSLKSKADVGHIELMLADQGVVILLRHLKKLPDSDIALIEAFSSQYKINFFALYSHSDLHCLAGSEKLSYQLKPWDCTFNFSPSDFLQVNAAVNQKMVAQALQWLAVNENDQVLDLFCGLGNFTLPIARIAASVVGVEGVQTMVDRASANASFNLIKNASFYQADLSAENLSIQPWAKQKFTKVLLDPARAGAFDCLPFIVKLKPSVIVYVSCDPLTLARDSQLLLENGYKLDKLGLLDMFPQTKHIESMALFTL